MFIENFRLKTFVQKVLCGIVELIDFARLHPRREMMKRAVNETVEYLSTHASDAIGLDTGKELLERTLEKVRSVEGSYLEFGVYKGATINFIAAACPKKKIWGFDSFEGLPEEWPGNPSKFDAGRKLPRVRSNVELAQGWFDRTLPAWLEKETGPIAFVHIDCDIYRSTKTIFDAIGSRLKPGAVIVFDEYFGYPGWQNHEFKAFQEFVRESGVEYEYLYYARIQCAVRITHNPLS